MQEAISKTNSETQQNKSCCMKTLKTFKSLADYK